MGNRELQRLRGERGALQALSVPELTSLAETLMNALRRTQREYEHKFKKRDDEQLCVACLSERKNVVLQPCHHLALCTGCFAKCNSTCPQCRSAVQGHLVIYT